MLGVLAVNDYGFKKINCFLIAQETYNNDVLWNVEPIKINSIMKGNSSNIRERNPLKTNIWVPACLWMEWVSILYVNDMWVSGFYVSGHIRERNPHYSQKRKDLQM